MITLLASLLITGAAQGPILIANTATPHACPSYAHPYWNEQGWTCAGGEYQDTDPRPPADWKYEPRADCYHEGFKDDGSYGCLNRTEQLENTIMMRKSLGDAARRHPSPSPGIVNCHYANGTVREESVENCHE